MHGTPRQRTRPPPRGLTRYLSAALLTGCLAACHQEEPWKLTDVHGQLPDLSFDMTSDTGRAVTQVAFNGDITLLYFGYTHCPDVCPQTMAKLAQVLAQLGDRAQRVKILFVTVDPSRDTPQALHDYVDAFDARHAVGLTGSASQVKLLAQRYRVAYQAEQARPDGSYDVSHSSVIEIFDAEGHARLVGSDSDSVADFVHDLRQLAAESS